MKSHARILAALVAIRVAARPADANHPYGHHKIEYFSAVLEGVLIVVAWLATAFATKYSSARIARILKTI